MAIVTQEYRNPSQDKIQRNFKYFLELCIVTIVLYAPQILNANIEQGRIGQGDLELEGIMPQIGRNVCANI